MSYFGCTHYNKEEADLILDEHRIFKDPEFRNRLLNEHNIAFWCESCRKKRDAEEFPVWWNSLSPKQRKEVFDNFKKLRDKA